MLVYGSRQNKSEGNGSQEDVFEYSSGWWGKSEVVCSKDKSLKGSGDRICKGSEKGPCLESMRRDKTRRE